MEFKVFESSEGNVWKYVFTKEDMVAEAVLYRYNDFYERTVICCSTMSGCPVGCKFCGTGNKFIRNLTADEIVKQIVTILKDKGKRFQIMFMSMGEPLLNWDAVEEAIVRLHVLYSNAELLLSTIAPNEPEVWKRVIDISKDIDKVGLQFSIHKSSDHDRDKLIPYENKLTLREIRDIGTIWWKETGRHPYLNYCIDGSNDAYFDAASLKMLFSPVIFNFTFSVVCSANENMKEAGFRELDKVRKFESLFLNEGYNTRVFNPDGQDDIGGGCGQLWYVQQWMREHGDDMRSGSEHGDDMRSGSERVEKLRKFLIDEGYSQTQTFDSRNIAGDPMSNIYDEDGITVDYCYYYDYLEIFGLSYGEYTSLGDILDIC